ncbi:MAG: hypothetical protein KGO53_10605 [Alphaproteobacteria bacterium]|nr:hypothetical protein [Alphaproteobacteria bacterium]
MRNYLVMVVAAGLVLGLAGGAVAAAKKKPKDGGLKEMTHAQALDACRKEFPQATGWSVSLDSKGVWQCEATQ